MKWNNNTGTWHEVEAAFWREVKAEATAFLREFQALSAYEQRLLHAYPATCPLKLKLKDAVLFQKLKLNKTCSEGQHSASGGCGLKLKLKLTIFVAVREKVLGG
jgi:hypothetical protein